METSFLLAYARFYRIDHGYFKRERNKNMDSQYPKIFLFTLEENECKMADVHDSHSYVLFHMFRCNEIQLQIHARDRPVADARSWSFQKPLQKFGAGIANWRKADKEKKVVLSRIFVGERNTWFHNGLKQGLGKEKKGGPGGFRIIIKQRKNTRNDNNMVVGPQNDFMPQVQFFCPRSRQNPESFPA